MVKLQRLFVIFLIFILMRSILTKDKNCNQILAPENNESHSFNISQVTNCVQKLGNMNLSISDATNIWKSVINLFNGTSNIPEETYLVLGKVIRGINAADYENITFTDVDMIQVFGKDYNLTYDQLSAIADRVLKDFPSKGPEQYTAYDLKALRKILCGYSASDIQKIHPSAYKDASNEIGQLNCKSEIMTEFASLATHKEAFGPSDKWNDDIKEEVGKVKKYLPK